MGLAGAAGQCGNGGRVMGLPGAGMGSCTSLQLILQAQHGLCVPHLRRPGTDGEGWTGCSEPPGNGFSTWNA